MHITHDLHIHTTLSKCAQPTASPEAYMQEAKALGLTTLGFSNHVWDTAVSPAPNSFYEGQDIEHVCSLVCPKESGMTFLRGCEAEYFDVLGMSEAALRQLDYVMVAHSHSQHSAWHPDMDRSDKKKYAETLCTSFSELVEHPLSRYITAIAHPFLPVGNKADADDILFRISDDRLESLFADANYKGIALEINARAFSECGLHSMHRRELFRMYEIAKECGCKFVFGSDCHDPEKYSEYVERFDVLASLLELTEKDFIPIARQK